MFAIVSVFLGAKENLLFGSNTKLGVLFDQVISRQFSDPHHDKGADYHDPWYRNQVPTRSEFFRPDAFGGRMLGCDSVRGVGWPKRCDMFQFWCIMIFTSRLRHGQVMGKILLAFFRQLALTTLATPSTPTAPTNANAPTYAIIPSGWSL